MENVELTKEKSQTAAHTPIQQSTGSIAQSTSSSPKDAVNPHQAQKRTNLEARVAKIEQQISETVVKQAEVDRQLKTSDPQAVVKAHIKLLHDYNEIRDVGQGLMGIIAEQRGVRIVDVYRDFGVAEGD